MFPPATLISPGHVLLVTDELPSPADFILHQILGTQLKDPNCCRCILVSVSGDLDRWKAVAAKSNLNLTEHLNSGSFAFIDVLAEIDLPASTRNSGTKPAFDATSILLSRDGIHGTHNLVIVDDITSLQWVGFPPLELIRFSRALHALCLKFNACLVLRHHTVTPAESDDLFRHLLQMSSYHIDVRPLASGRSGTVSGEIALHAGPSIHHVKVPLVPRNSAVQYRLTDGGALFFERGSTSSGVL